ncbi:MAG: tRNA (adenosine(37)-N6)-threonylcarbamoyltransferase complex transferase subunit TsaD [Chloroflexi bacterium RBG_13_48_17]|nr:MAG: tRNA (adenosine(37)-N6)-threonylcarbamoyltransferase complex transferase subunit TsaD [Chloroflexi bacterium RBG_13_48_17]
MKILGIETSCDETAAAVVEDGDKILSNVVASQVDIHSRYGGIVPEVASRQHLITILPVLDSAMVEAKASWQDIEAVAATIGPGLAGSLLVGVNVAKAIALAHRLPLIGVNHLEAHIYANWLSQNKPEFPCLCLIVSGGHSDLVLMGRHGQFEKLGRTRDDAAGEAFDKAARILGLGYPGGPAMEKAAATGTPSFSLPRAWLKGTNDFSFSGLKTALLHLVRDHDFSDPARVAEAAASFQQAVVDVLTTKTIQAAEKLGVKQILLSGGVASNKGLRDSFTDNSPVPVLIPPPGLCTDNAAMVAACGYHHYRMGKIDGWDVDVVPGLSLG